MAISDIPSDLPPFQCKITSIMKQTANRRHIQRFTGETVIASDE